MRRRLGYQPQELGFPRGFSTMAFVNYMAVLKEWADRDLRTTEVRRVLDLVGLGDVATKRISRLSGGQRRRVALAQALLGTPELLVLDEPTTGSTPSSGASLRGVLADIAATSTMVISTHQTEDVAALCSRVVVLDAGRVHFDGTVPGLVALATGKVWMAAEPDPAAHASWRTASGRYRNVGEHVPSGAELVEPASRTPTCCSVALPASRLPRPRMTRRRRRSGVMTSTPHDAPWHRTARRRAHRPPQSARPPRPSRVAAASPHPAVAGRTGLGVVFTALALNDQTNQVRQ